MYKRLANPLKSQSFFLFGARGTGKSTLLSMLENSWSKELTFKSIDLLDFEIYQKLLTNPKVLEEIIQSIDPKKTLIVIDEIQKIPALLDVVHRMIERKKFRFALTGSSARKLKRSGVNLLAGRALQNFLHPLTHHELASDFNLEQVLLWGSLPFIFSLQDDLHKKEFLRTYVNTYIKEEIKEEQLVRNIAPFLRFIDVVAQQNGEENNFASIARDVGVDSTAVERYFEIMVDTLLLFELPPFEKSVRKRQSKRSRYYLFDLGIKRAIENSFDLPIRPQTSSYGKAFEHFFILECIRLNDYYKKGYKFSFLRTKDNLEIDLIVEKNSRNKIAIEIKSSKDIRLEDFKNQSVLANDLKAPLWVVYTGIDERANEFVKLYPWQTALKNLFLDE